MKLISVNVAQPREICWKDRVVSTGIFKEPIAGRVAVRKHNLDGDRQADLSVHGGAAKAVYAYASEHYDFWREELPDVEFAWGKFGENLTTQGLSEDAAFVGDHFRMGSSILMVTQPRLPCYKLAAKFNRDDIIERFLHRGRSGIYFSVIEEGELGAGDKIELLQREQTEISIATVVQIFLGQIIDPSLIEKAAALSVLPPFWRKRFRSIIKANLSD
ncbi:MAG: MOSC domain-containing protein [Acidobacteria bacterium]|nr:MOSC domain-containing protein [Acidobacteriota bacterium]